MDEARSTDDETPRRMSHVLFVSRQFPHDMPRSVHGVYIRMRLFLDALKASADTMEMLFYVEPGVDASPEAMRRAADNLSAAWGIQAKVTLCPVEPAPDRESFWDHYLRPATNFFRQALVAGTSGPHQLAAFEAALERCPDAIFVHRLDAMPPALLTRRPLPPLYLDLDDIEHVRWIREIRQPPFWRAKPLYYLQVPSLVCGERQAIKLSRRAFVCSDLDRRYLARRWRLPQAMTIPNAVAIPSSYASGSAAKTMLFLATYAYGPNIKAAEFLINDVWPLVRKLRPDAHLIIAGNKPERLPSYAMSPAGVEFTGFVEDLEELYPRVRIVCCPILSGGGTRLKILEAAAHGKAIVSTRLGAEGLDLRDGREIILRDGGPAFAQACADLLGDASRCEALGLAAREVVADRYDRRQIVERIREEIKLAKNASTGSSRVCTL